MCLNQKKSLPKPLTFPAKCVKVLLFGDNPNLSGIDTRMLRGTSADMIRPLVKWDARGFRCKLTRFV